MNTNNPLHCECLNPFSNYPIFFKSDAPHLMKRLRNSLFNSGFCHKRFTRHMMNNGKYILWDHVNDVYNREKSRNLYVTDLRSSHINLDNLSKMHVLNWLCKHCHKKWLARGASVMMTIQRLHKIL